MGQTSFDERLFKLAMSYVAEELGKDNHHRLRSWDHSHEAWKKYVVGKLTSVEASLQLAFYLASWGMYRGSTELLHRDYKVLVPVVKLLKAKSKEKWEDCFFATEDSGELAGRIVLLAEGLSGCVGYAISRPGISTYKASDTLLSKVLLNTLACVPAFDAQVKEALKDIIRGYTQGNGFRRKSIQACIELARHNKNVLLKGQGYLQEKTGTTYPLTKVLDLFLWYYPSLNQKN